MRGGTTLIAAYPNKRTKRQTTRRLE